MTNMRERRLLSLIACNPLALCQPRLSHSNSHRFKKNADKIVVKSLQRRASLLRPECKTRDLSICNNNIDNVRPIIYAVHKLIVFCLNFWRAAVMCRCCHGPAVAEYVAPIPAHLVIYRTRKATPNPRIYDTLVRPAATRWLLSAGSGCHFTVVLLGPGHCGTFCNDTSTTSVNNYCP